MGARSSAPKRPTFYHDYGAEGWVYVINRKNPSINNLGWRKNNRVGDYAKIGINGSYDQFVSPTITQYPRAGKVAQHSDNNISFGGSGFTYTIDMGPYVSPSASSLFRAIRINGGYYGADIDLSMNAYMDARSSDPFNFKVKQNGFNVPFEIRKIDGDARSWPAWYLWVSTPLRPGSRIEFTFDVWSYSGGQRRITVFEDRIGLGDGGIRFAPVIDYFNSTWLLNKP